MKKREKMLLQILVSFALFAGVWVVFFGPAIEKRQEMKDRQMAAEEVQSRMIMLMQDDTLDDQIKEQLGLSQENYEFFYSVLNTYTIDQILNDVAKEKKLSVRSLQIGEYVDASADFPVEPKEEESEEENAYTAKLLKSSTTIDVAGSYENILAYVDALNVKSSCLRVEKLSLSPNKRDASGSADQNASISISVYGISEPVQE